MPANNDQEMSSVSDLKAVIPPEPKKDNNCKESPLFILVLVLGLVIGLVALVIAAISLGRSGGQSSVIVNDGGQTDAAASAMSLSANGNIWTFAIGHDGTNIEYIDDVSGTLRGFHVDIVDAVCAQANKDCRLVWDIYENCWDSQAGQRSRGGFGLMARWYDACTGWFNTYERALTVQFTDEFRLGLSGIFYVRSGNPGNFDATNIRSGQMIGFVDGWASDEHCLARSSATIQGVPLATSQVIHYATREELKAAIGNGDVAAGFANTNVYAGDTDLETAGNAITTCVKGGGSMMSRMDSSLNVWWNPAWAAIKDTDVYQRICDRAATNHGHMPGATGDLLCLS